MKQNKTKILVMNFGGLGDQILFFPALKTLRKIFKHPSITYVTESRSKSAALLTNTIDRVITCDIKGKNKYSNLLRLLFNIWEGGYDYVISSGSSKFISIFLFLTGIKNRIGYNSGKLSEKLLTKAVKLNKNQYAGNMYHDLVSALNSEVEAEMPDIHINPENLIWANQKIGDRDKFIVTIHPGVSKLSIEKNIFKSWAVKNWFELIEMLINTGKCKIILTGGPDDKEVFAEIREHIKENNLLEKDVINLYGHTKNICDLAALISLSDIFVCVDSAPMHIGVGTRTPMVAFFGPTDPNKLLPVHDCRFAVVRNDELECSPCLWGRRQVSCEEKHCLNISAEKVFRAIEKALL